MRVRCGPTKNRDRCHYLPPRAAEPSFLRKVLFGGTLKKEMESVVGGGTFGSFEEKTGTGTHRFAVRSAAVYIQRPPGPIRQRLRPQKIPGNLGVCRQRGGLVRTGSRRRWSGVVRSRGAAGERWSRLRV